MIFDTDIVIWAIRGRVWAQQLLVSADTRTISLATWMELVESVRDKRELTNLRFCLNYLFAVKTDFTGDFCKRIFRLYAI